MNLFRQRNYKIVSSKLLLIAFCFITLTSNTFSQGTRLLRQPSISPTHIAFAYGGDIWVSHFESQKVVRLTSTPAVESDPHFSPDGTLIAFTSNRSGSNAVYTVSVEGGTPKRLTWHPSDSRARGWTPDGKKVLYASSRETAPTSINRLWTIPYQGGNPSMLTSQWGFDGSFAPDGNQIIIDKMSRWDIEWRAYRGGQNTPLIILDLNDLSETLLPNEKTTDTQPLWIGDQIYFLSDRDWTVNIWAYSPKTGELKQITHFKGTDVKWVDGNQNKLAFEHDGYLHLLDPLNNKSEQLNFTINADFPWAETKWEDVSRRPRSVSISPTGKRAIMESRGEIFTTPVEHGDTRNLTNSSDAADRAPIWSPKGDQVAWFSDKGGKGYALMISTQDGLTEPKSISIGISKMAWEPTWSPDGKYIAFVDDDVRIRVVDLEKESILTADVGGINLERGSMGICWSPDSKWLAYSKTGNNNFRQVKVWSLDDKKVTALTDSFADAFSPAWDLDKEHLYFLASTDLALASNWASTSAMTANPEYAAYIINLQKDDDSPFKAQSDEEEVKKGEKESTKSEKKADKKKKGKEEEKAEEKVEKAMTIDFDGIERRTLSLPIPKRNYGFTLSGPSGSVFIGEHIPNSRGYTLQKFDLKKREAKEFVSGVSQLSISADAKKLLAQVNGSWKVMDASRPNGKDAESMKFSLKMKLNRMDEWKQIFEEAWRYERDYFYDPDMHGRDWNAVYDKYSPLVPYVKHRTDLNYILDQVNGELSVGHSFVYGGDFPEVEKSTVGLLGADLVIENNAWNIKRIYTTESWNPDLTGPLDQPGMKIEEGYYIVGINGKELKSSDNPYEFLDGTAGQQTTLHINKEPKFEGSWKEIVEPIRSENALRKRAWVEDNRRMVDKLSNGRLAYIWVPNTSSPGTISFNRYFFAQQDKEGAIIDERFNQGGYLDDYMVDLMTRSLRAGLTNEVPNGKPFRLPGGILGPKILLINEMAGSGGDFFPWVFRQQKAGLIVGKTTWGGLVKSSIHYSLVDGGALTAPDNAVYDPIKKEWVTENKGAYPDIEVRQDAKSLTNGIDPQLERAVKEMLLLIEKQPTIDMTPPPFSTPAKQK